ncbi:thioredoxin family protein [Comamonas composti]|uniref:thioredoxin family protein n=1 Tax=Comamonas composti TaxID=408558 RepID=UPI0004023D14|nr:thioredoxin family protein [Comamonas composti]
MTYQAQHLPTPPAHEAIQALQGAVLLEFGTPWCGHCQRAQPLLQAALEQTAAITHLKIEDGPGKRLGRIYGVKLWPTLVFLRDGQEITRLVRPESLQQITQALDSL